LRLRLTSSAGGKITLNHAKRGISRD
jgi:hypothetical protein